MQKMEANPMFKIVNRILHMACIPFLGVGINFCQLGSNNSQGFENVTVQIQGDTISEKINYSDCAVGVTSLLSIIKSHFANKKLENSFVAFPLGFTVSNFSDSRGAQFVLTKLGNDEYLPSSGSFWKIEVDGKTANFGIDAFWMDELRNGYRCQKTTIIKKDSVRNYFNDK